MTAPACLDRRGFLRLGGAALGAAAVPGLFAEEKKDDPFGGFKLGVQSYTFREFDLEQCLKRMKDMGLHYIELYQKHAPLSATPEQIKALLALCKDYGVTPVCWGVQTFTKNHDANKKVFEFGKAMGLMSFSADPDPDAFDSLDKLCEEHRIGIGIHPHGPAGGGKLHRWYSAEIILDAVKNHNPLIGSCLDTGHLIRSAQAPFNKQLVPEQQVRVMGARNIGMHLKDHDNEKKHDVVFGQGVLNLAEVLKALRDVKFKGHLSIEYEHNAKEPTADVKACVEVFKESVKKIG
jgi:sugar phosphate isomerase/epimerase